MKRSTRVSCLFATLFLLGLPNAASADCGENRWGGRGNEGYRQPQQVWAYQGQSCSYYPGYGPQCVPGLVCTNAGFNVGFGVCQVPYNNGGWNNRGWRHENGGEGHGGWGGHGGWHH